MQTVNSSVAFGPLSGSGPRVQNTAVTLPAAVTQATAILTGFTAEFSGGNDHHLGRLDIRVSVPAGGVAGANVTVQITFGLRDWSGSWDDQYDGQVFFTVIGE
jgi:hypothetical protein